MNGFIKLHRQIQEWEWYDDANVFRVFLHLLLNANFKDKNWKGLNVKRGQVITGRKSLSSSLKLSEQQIKTALKKLKSTGEITTKATNKYTVVTLVNFEVYQDKKSKSSQQDTQQETNEQPTDTQQVTTTEEGKELKEGEERKDKYPFIVEFQKIQKGELMRKSELDKRFHFGLFEESWSEEFKNSILGMWRYLESKEYKPEMWGNIGTLTTQTSVLRSMLKKHSEKEIQEAFDKCKFNSKKSWNMYLGKEKKKSSSSSYKSTTPSNMNDDGTPSYMMGLQ